MRKQLPVRWRVTVILAVAAAVNFADRSALSAVFVPLKADLKLSDTQLGTLLSLFLWCYAFASPFSGGFADRHSRSRVIFWSVGLWSVFTFLIGCANGFLMLCILSITLGLSESPFNPSGFALIADHHEGSTRAKAMSIFSIGFQLGVVGGGACAGYMAQRFGWRSGFWTLGAIGLVLAILARRRVVDARPHDRSSRQLAKPAHREALGFLLKVPSYHILLAKQILTESMTWMFFGWLPYYLYQTYHLKLGPAAFIATTMLQATLVVGIAGGGWISDRAAARNPGRRMLVLGLFTAAAAPFPLVFFWKPSLALVSMAISTCSLLRGLGYANERPTVCEIIPTRFRSTAYGIINAFASGSGALAVFLTGLFKRHFGLDAIFSVASICFLLTGIGLVLAYRIFMPADMARCRDAESAHPGPLLAGA